jgi:hypothetical protein
MVAPEGVEQIKCGLTISASLTSTLGAAGAMARERRGEKVRSKKFKMTRL